MAVEYDFQGLAARLLSSAETLLQHWLPGGRREGREYKTASLQGGRGRSLSVNMDTGRWADFALGDKGGDLISLFAAIQGVTQGAAARTLAEDENYTLRPEGYTPPPPKPAGSPEVGPPPSMDVVEAFNFVHHRHGTPARTWTYLDETGAPLMVVARYDTKDGKEVLPWTWHLKDARWVARALPAPRPLYGLELLPDHPEAPVLLVEGEKACLAARGFKSPYVVMAWPGGGKAVSKIDWTPLAGRSVLLWPDADRKVDETGASLAYEDQPGARAMQRAGEALLALGCTVKILNVGVPDSDTGFDAADAVAEGWDWDAVLAWARPRVAVFTGAPEPAPEPDPAWQEGKITAEQLPKVEAGLIPTVPAVRAEVMPPRPPTPPDDEAPNMSPSIYATWERLGIATTKAGVPHYNMDNVVRFLENETAIPGLLWFDDFHQKMFTQFDLAAFQPLTHAREWRDTDELALVTYLQRHVGLTKLSLETVSQGVRLYASEHRRNEPKDWLGSLKWDGVERIEEFMHHAFGCEMDTYSASVSSNFLKSIAARILNPGIKVDTMLILFGPQGVKKSTALEALGGPWYAEVSTNVQSTDFYLALQGKVLIEISEMDAFRKADAETVKKMLSTKSDRYRAPYGRHTEDHPRACVFAGSTNEQFFLSDPTGARRFWPIGCVKIDVQLIKDQREQLYAEAAARVLAGETWWVMPDVETRARQEIHRQADEWEQIIDAWAADNFIGPCTISDVATQALHIRPQDLDAGIQRRFGKVLRKLGWSVGVETVGRKSVKLWTPAKK